LEKSGCYNFPLFGELFLRVPCNLFVMRVTSPVAPSCCRISPRASPATEAHSPPMNAVIRHRLHPSSSPDLISEPSPHSCCPAQPPPLPHALPAGCAAPKPMCTRRVPCHRRRAGRGDRAGWHRERAMQACLGHPSC
jgi:hypothetical protein